jgi:aldehyde:ferredoxin oxidoreductase
MGYAGRIVRVDLTNRTVKDEHPDEKFYRTYFGGRGFVAHYLLKETPAGADPLGPDNVLVIAGSVIAGITSPGVARTSVGAKSPLTGGYGDAEGGGHFGVRLRWAECDGLVITGAADRPVYVHVTPEGAEIRDAAHLWGLEVYESQEAIRAELGDDKISAAVIGPGGEKMIPFACVALGTHNYAGRTGLGAVMGSKNLKAVSVSGQRRPEPADPDAVAAIAKTMSQNYGKIPLAKDGTPILVRVHNQAGALPTNNFRSGAFEGVDTLSSEWLVEHLRQKKWGCHGCPVRCKNIVAKDDPATPVTTRYGGPEYETIGAFGTACGVSDLTAVAWANEICDAHGLDTITAGMMIAGALEAGERGLIPPDLADGLDLTPGSKTGMIELLRQMVALEGLGGILARGPAKAAEILGPEAGRYFLHVKNQSLPLHEPRWKPIMGVGFTLSPTGADHQHNVFDTLYANEEAPSFNAARNLGILDAPPREALSPEKARLYTYMILHRSVFNSVLICTFLGIYQLEDIKNLVNAVTGWNVSTFELLKSAERAMNLARAFNAREGFTAEDDVIPERFFEPLEGGALDGASLDKKAFYETRDLIYDMCGWNRRSAAPKRWKLHELALSWAIPMLEERGVDID